MYLCSINNTANNLDIQNTFKVYYDNYNNLLPTVTVKY